MALYALVMVAATQRRGRPPCRCPVRASVRDLDVLRPSSGGAADDSFIGGGVLKDYVSYAQLNEALGTVPQALYGSFLDMGAAS